MADFPQGRLPVRVRLAFGADPAGDPSAWTWTDVSAAIDQQTIAIQRGRANEASTTAPTSTGVELNNPDGDFTPDHPDGAHYPDVVQGVPAQFWLQAGGPHLLAPDAPGARARVASSSDLDVTEDLDIAVELALDTLPSQQPPDFPDPFIQIETEVIGRYNITGTPGNRMWRILLSTWGRPEIWWSTDGDDFFVLRADDVVPYGSGQRFALRAFLDVDNGDGGHTARFYTAPTIDGPWTQLGADVTGTGTTSINQTGDASLELADINTIGFARGAGRYYAVALRDGFDGTLLADPDFTNQAIGVTSFTDDAGNLWELQQDCEITDWVRRAVGNVDEWLPEWPYGDLSDEASGYVGEARTAITLSGILRRLGIGQDQLQSTLRRFIPTHTDVLLQYWPMEDGADTVRASSALPGGGLLITSGLRFAADDSLVSSDALPTTTSGASIQATLPGLPTGADEWRLEMVYFMDELPEGDPAGLIAVDTAGGGISRIVGRISDTVARLELIDDEGSVAFFAEFSDSDALAQAATGWSRVTLLAMPDGGGDTEYRMQWTPIGDTSLWWVFRDGMEYTKPTNARMRWVALDSLPIGHITYTTDANSNVYGGGIGGADDGWRGELALDRMRRLAHEEQLPLSALGDPNHSQRMGPQGIATVLELIRECEDADGGILTEQREVPGLQYRAQYLLHNQPVALTLDAGNNEIVNPFAPVLNDQRLRNVIEVQRRDGASEVAVDEESIARSSRYKEGQITLNVADDEQLPGIAAWRLHLGTWPGMRYPAVSADLSIAPQLIDAWLNTDSGSRMQVINLPPQHPADTVDLLAEGTVETITPTKWTVEASCSPAGPWTVATVDGSRSDTDGSTLAAGIDSDDTSISVASGWFEDFEDTSIVVDVTGTWERTSSESHAGSWSLRSADIGDSETSDAVVQVPDGATTVQFWYRVSSEAGFDFFRFLIDGVQQLEASGEGLWTQSDVFDVSGASELTFRYTKDATTSSGSDAAFIDDLSFVIGPLWTTDGAEMPFDIRLGGEVVTVTAISGSTSPQTFTVTRSVNSIVKAHVAGTDVRLAQPAIIAMQ